MTTAIKKSNILYPVKGLAKRFEKVNFDLAIQRHEVWDDVRKSLLIHSLLYGYPIPAVYARKLDNSDVDHMMDGKQRLSTIFAYVKQGDPVKDHEGNKVPLMENGEIAKDDKGKPLYKTWSGFALKGVPDVTYIDEANNDAEVTVDVNGMKFLDLPEPLRDELLSQIITVTRFENMTDDEQDEMFLRLNNGVPLRNMELTRAHAGGALMNFIENITSMHFFSQSVAITETARTHFTDDEAVLQVLAVVYYAGTDAFRGFGGNEMRNFVHLLREQGGFPEDKSEVVLKVTDYLGKAFPYKESTLKKVHIPSLFTVAIQAEEMGVPPEKFGGYWQEFMDKRYKVGTTYGVAASSGSAKPEKVAQRVSEMQKDFTAHIENAPNYTEPKKIQNARAKAAEIAAAAEQARKQAEALAEQVAREKTEQDQRNERVVEGAEQRDQELVKA